MTELAATRDKVMRTIGIHERIAAEVPQMRRGTVWCTVCGHYQPVDSGYALAHGWPKHCGYTMTIDSPEERAARKK